jgi:dipeptidyl-peptidase-4
MGELRHMILKNPNKFCFMNLHKIVLIQLLFIIFYITSSAQVSEETGLLTLDRIFNSKEFIPDYPSHVQWIEEGEAYIILEPYESNSDWDDLVRYETNSQKRTLYVAASGLIPPGDTVPLDVEEFILSPDESKILVFTNSSKVWRTNTKGDYWVFDLKTGKLFQLGVSFLPSSLMFAKFSSDSRSVAYVYAFNIYIENITDHTILQMTTDGTGDIINGTFDWVYEEEFGCRDGFRWNKPGTFIAFWQLDASEIGTFYMINNTDSVYSRIIPVQYPKAGQEPSACRVGLIDVTTGKTTWIPVPGGEKENYIPRMQWINDDLLLIQQINLKQNHLKFYTYTLSTRHLQAIYEELENTWVDLIYPDISVDGWEMEDLIITTDNRYVLRMSETKGWRHIYKINVFTGEPTLLTPGDYDVARYYAANDKYVYFSASPSNSTQRYLYRVSLSGRGDTARLTPAVYSGVNWYNISKNGKYSIHKHSNINTPPAYKLISLPSHHTIKILTENTAYKEKINNLQLPLSKFFTVTTEDGIKVDGIITLPVGFDDGKKYPVLFYVYGEPWEQVATDSWGSLWNIMLAQRGYITIAMDNRGSPCLKGSEWRKSIYRKIGVVNSHDQAMAAREVLKWNFVDTARIAVWGWSGGGSMTLNLLFKYPEIYKTGIAVAALSSQLTYDNIYQERYMGLPSENLEDYIKSSPVTYAQNLRGNLLIIHGTGDDNVHYQNAELLINELIKHNKQFSVMPYPNRTHAINEGENTRRHLFTLMTNYLYTTTPPGGR